MIGALSSMYSAIIGKARAKERYLGAKLGQVHLADQVKPGMNDNDWAKYFQKDMQLGFNASSAWKEYERCLEMEEVAQAMINREMKARQYRIAQGYLG
jgi:hypothetical protein